MISVSDNRRPIYGVFTEPIRGNLQHKNESQNIDVFS